MNIKPKVPKYLEYLGTKKHPPHTLQHQKNHSCTKKHMQQSTTTTKSPMPTVTINGHIPHPPTCVWVGWVFFYFRCCLMSCFHCRSCFHHHFHCLFDRHHLPPHPICLVVVLAIPILPLRCVQCCSHCLHGVE